MPSWKKVIVSGSDASFNSLYVLGGATSDGGFTGSLFGTASQAISASYAATASSADAFNVRTSLTASGLNYPTTDGLENQVLKTDGTNDLSFGDVNTIFETVYVGENITKSDPLYISGSLGANPIVYKADAANAAKMPVTYIASETIAAGNTTRGIVLGKIDGIDLTGYAAGTEVFVAAGGGWTATRPTGSAIVQILGIVTKGGNGGQGLVLNPGPVELPNLQAGYAWVGDATGVPQAVSTSSLLVSTASFASTASYVELAQTASYVLNAVSASYALSASYAPASDTAISASYALSASYATTASFASNLTDQGVVFCTTASTLWSAQHNLDTLTPIVNVYDSNNVQLIPASITSLNYNVTQIAFSTPVSGCAVISKGSGLSSVSALTASYALTASMVMDQGFNYCNDTASTVWTIIHNLNTTSPLVDVYNSSNSQVIPAGITSLDANTTQIDFSVATAGCAILSRGSGISSVAVASASFATTASYSISASYAENVRTVCYFATTSSAVWTIPHDFGCKYVMVNVYDTNDDAIIPNRINLTDSNTTTIYFTVPTSGTALLIPANCCGNATTTTTSTTTTTTTAEPTTTTSTTTSTTTAEPTTTTSTTTSTTTAEPTTTTSTTTSTTTAEPTTTTSTTTSTTTAEPTTTTSTTTSTTTALVCQQIFLYPNNANACDHLGSLTEFDTDNALAPTRLYVLGECGVTPVVGGNQWYSQGAGADSYQVDNGGFVVATTACP